jgi:HD-GYP domain-containing protein (c-di-GMP phosphodiesterase class II)
MTVSDIYDALTARDRPYKKAVSVQKALDILSMEVMARQLDPELVRLFIDGKVFESATTDER